MIYDMIIIGAGPAGMTAAIYALRANKRVLILEKETIGGQMASSPLIENYPGLKGISGSELANELYEQVDNLGGEIEIEEVLDIKEGNIKEVVTDMGTHQGKTVVIATGAKYRRLGLKNEENFIGDGISFCVACDGAFYKDKTVAVIGGGNSAIINAIALSDICKKVYIVQNLKDLTAEANLKDRIREKKNVEITCDAIVKSINGKEKIESIDILINNKEEKNIVIDGMFESIGLEAQNDFAEKCIKLNDYGYVETDEMCETNKEGIYAAGDCRSKKIRQITTATSDGSISAINAINYLNN